MVVVVVVVGGTVVVVVVGGGDVVGEEAIVDGTVVDVGVVTGGTVVDDNGAVVADPAAGVAIGDAPDEAPPVVRRALGAADVAVVEVGGVEVDAAAGGRTVDVVVGAVDEGGGAERWLTVA